MTSFEDEPCWMSEYPIKTIYSQDLFIDTKFVYVLQICIVESYTSVT